MLTPFKLATLTNFYLTGGCLATATAFVCDCSASIILARIWMVLAVSGFLFLCSTAAFLRASVVGVCSVARFGVMFFELELAFALFMRLFRS